MFNKLYHQYIKQSLTRIKRIENIFIKILLWIVIIILAIGIFYILSIAMMFIIALLFAFSIVSFFVKKAQGRKAKPLFTTQTEQTTGHIKIIRGKVEEE